jgi:anaerobic ribonucleoside-triphosphate reductase activating protein
MQPLVKKHIISVDDLCVLIEKSTGMFGIEGVSFIGGEPFLQAESLACLAGRCRAKGLTALSFSGYRYEELISGAINGAKSLLSQLDILIDGEYRDNEPETNRRWIGSRNQRVFYLTSAYPNRLEYEISEQSVEYNVYDTSIQINGWPFDEISR